MLFDISKAGIEELQQDLFLQKQVRLSVLRLDKIHPLLSGNKIFKLHYFLEDALQSAHKTILTFGGAYSNHLAATAFACKNLQLNSIGIVRGEKPEQLSSTLQQCLADGMRLKFISRQDYDKKETVGFNNDLRTEFGNCTMVPEGGYHPLGAKGASLIMDSIKGRVYSHICTASGTATTLAGILMTAKPTQTIVNIPVLKGITDTVARIKYLSSNLPPFINLQTLDGYHFGGYAKKNKRLIEFMNHCWTEYKLPLDFVYTAKMLYAVIDSMENNYFKAGSDILCLHTGGLQGNKSLPLSLLLF